MSNFPAGSKIIVTTPWTGETAYKNGDIFTVDAPADPGVYVKVSGEKIYIASDEFEAYTETFKVGDKVITTADNEEWGYYVGQTGVVDYIDFHEPKVRLKGAGYHFTEDLKLAPAKVEPTPTSHIKVLATNHPREYEVGDILEVSENQSWCGGGEIRVTNKHGYTSVVFKGQWEYVAAPVADEPLAEWEKELLEVTPRTIAFKDIQVGDKIKRERRDSVVIGVIAMVTPTGAYTAETSTCLAYFTSSDTYTLLERPEPPKPPKPNPFAEAKVGSLALQDDGYVWYKVKPDLWKFLSKSGGGLEASTGETNALMAQEDDRKITYSAP